MNKITYHREGDYFIPDLYLPKQPEGAHWKIWAIKIKLFKEF